MQTLFQDLRYGARQLLKRPGFTFLAIVSMALGIGANTAIFSLVDTVAFRPLPVRNASELQELYGVLHNGADYTLQSYLNYKDYRDRNQVFSGLMAYRIAVASLSHNGNNERVWGTMASANYFDVLGVPPLLGRGFLPETLPGEVPDPAHPPVACRFHPRCPYAFERCWTEDPLMLEVAPERVVACWLQTGATPPARPAEQARRLPLRLTDG